MSWNPSRLDALSQFWEICQYLPRRSVRKCSFPSFNNWIIPYILFIDGPTMMQLSTYVSMIIPLPMYKQVSKFDDLNYLVFSAILSFLYQFNDTCFKPLKLLFNLRAFYLSGSCSVCPYTWKLIGNCIQMFTFRQACGNAITNSIAFESSFCIFVIVSMSHTRSVFTTGEYFS